MKPNPEAWSKLKSDGNPAYKTGLIEPIDLYAAGEMIQDFATASAIKYLYRNRRDAVDKINPKDIHKAIHYCRMLLTLTDD